MLELSEKQETTQEPAIDVLEYRWLVDYWANKFIQNLPSGGRGRITKEDLQQEGWVALLEARQRYSPAEGSFETFATSYVRGYMLNYLQKNIGPVDMSKIKEGRSFEVHAEQVNVEDYEFIEPLQPYDWVVAKQAAERVQGLINSLPLREYVVWSMRYDRDCTLREVAITMSVSRQTVKNIEDRIKQRIRDEVFQG